MSTALAAPGRGSAADSEIRQLISDYSRDHRVEVVLRERQDASWSVTMATSGAADPSPGAHAFTIDLPGRRVLSVEVEGADPESATSGSRFLGQTVERAIRHHDESRFFGRELAERYEEITLLYTISEVLGSIISLEAAATTILTEVCDTLSVARAALWIYAPGTDHLTRVAAVGESGPSVPIRIDDEDSMTAAVFRGRAPMMLEPGEVFPRDDHYQTAHHDFFLSVPVSYSPPRGETRTIGVINLIGRNVEESFSAGDQKLITAIASQIGAAVENSRLVADSVRQERLSREMELAHDLQLKLLPSTAQFEEFCQVAARCAPADSVGGDFYHLFRLPGGRIGVMIGDVSSHGFAAALIMALTMSAVGIHASEGDAPSAVLRRVHAALIEELENTEMYLTLFYGVIDPVAGTLNYANAGHSHAFRIAEDGRTDRLPVTNPPFGLLDTDDYGERSIPWDAANDLLFLFTDGLSDSLDPGSGEATLIKLVSEGRHEPLNQLLESLFALESSSRDIPADDRSAVLLRL